MSSSDNNPRFKQLTNGTYRQWSGEMRAWLMKLGYWGLVSGVVTIPPPVEDIERREWLKMQSKAAGEIYLAVAPDQRMHLSGIEEDPVKMWTAL